MKNSTHRLGTIFSLNIWLLLRDESLLVRFQEPVDLVPYSLGDGVICISFPTYHSLLNKGCNLFFQSKSEPCSANWSYSATDNKKHECFNWAMESFTKSLQLSQTLNTYLWNDKILLQAIILKRIYMLVWQDYSAFYSYL